MLKRQLESEVKKVKRVRADRIINNKGRRKY
jgi:hypothetical protein